MDQNGEHIEMRKEFKTFPPPEFINLYFVLYQCFSLEMYFVKLTSFFFFSFFFFLKGLRALE